MYENWDVAVKEQERLNSQLKSYYELISAVREKFCDNDILEINEDFSFKRIMQLTSVVRLDGRAFCKISVNWIGECLGIKRINTRFDKVKKSLAVYSRTGLMYQEYGKNIYNHDLTKDEALSKLFSLPTNFDKVVGCIKKKVQEIVNKEIKPNDICYDWARAVSYTHLTLPTTPYV